MSEVVFSTVSFFLSFLGLLSVVGIFVGIPMGIVMLVTSGKQKDPKKKTRRVIWGIVLIAMPPVVIIVVLSTFAIVSTIMAGSV